MSEPPVANGEDPGARKRKRNRAILSCAPCKSKKIKCSRSIPCENCIRKGIASECRWSEKEFESPKQVYALDTVVDSLREHFEERIRHLEGLLHVQAATSSSQVSKVALARAYKAAGLDLSHTNPNTQQNGSIRDGSSSPGFSPIHDEAAGAAFALEVLAGGDFQSSHDISSKSDLTKSSLLSMDDFARRSILAAGANTRLEGNNRIPLLGFLNNRNITDSILACLQSRENSLKFLTRFVDALGWVLTAVHAKQFLAEFHAFWDHVAIGVREFDLPWLALLCIMLALELQQSQETMGTIQAEDLYQLSKLCLEFAEWRRCPTRRVVQAQFMTVIYVTNENDMQCAHTYLDEATDSARALGWHKLGTDGCNMPKPDISVQEGSLMARESAVRLWWDIVTRDWLTFLPWGRPVIPVKSFDTGIPRNFDDEAYENAFWDAVPLPETVVTPAMAQRGKIHCAQFVYKASDLGDPPIEEASVQEYYDRLCQIDDDFRAAIAPYLEQKGPWQLDKSSNWRHLIGGSGIHTRMMRIHRPFMVRGYKEPERFGRSTRTCVESALKVLEMLKKMEDLKAPYTAALFIGRHLLSVTVTLFIDVLHDIDIGVKPEVSDSKLKDVQLVINWLSRIETSALGANAEMGRKGKLLIQALQDAKEARRKMGGGNRQDYGRVLRDIAVDVKRSATETPPSANQLSTVSTSISSSSAPITWLDDPETRQLLSSLGLLDSSGGQWQQTNMGQLGTQMADNNISSFLNIDSMQSGFDILESYSFE